MAKNVNIVDIYYDFEFIENGASIIPISVGMIRPDISAEYYAVNSDIYYDEDLRHRIESHQWLMENVVPNLPVREKPRYRSGENTSKWGFLSLDTRSRLVKPQWVIRNEIFDFTSKGLEEQHQVRLNGWFCDYDHVCLMQMFGPMINRPKHLPMWTRDLKQEADRLGNPKVPDQTETEHNALNDARHVRVIEEFLAQHYAMYGDDGPCPDHPDQFGDH